MDGILEFAKNNYLILIILGGVFLLALIGYFYDRYQHRDIKIEKDELVDNSLITESHMEEKPVEESAVQPAPVQQPVAQPAQTPIASPTVPQNNNLNNPQA